jgi:hypothetical protein
MLSATASAIILRIFILLFIPFVVLPLLFTIHTFIHRRQEVYGSSLYMWQRNCHHLFGLMIVSSRANETYTI